MEEGIDIMPSIFTHPSQDHIVARSTSHEFQFPFSDQGAPAFLRWLRSHGIKGGMSHTTAGELVGFDVPDDWSGEQIEAFAHRLVDLVVEEATEKLARLRGGSSPAVPSTSPLAADLRRIADHFDPPPPDIVRTEYVAKRLGCTKTWIADLVRRGEIPSSCTVRGTGNGKPWKFHRKHIDQWIETR